MFLSFWLGCWIWYLRLGFVLASEPMAGVYERKANVGLETIQLDGCWSKDTSDVVTFAGGGVFSLKAPALLQFANLCASLDVSSSVSKADESSDADKVNQSKIVEPSSHLNMSLNKKNGCGSSFEQDFPKSILDFVEQPGPGAVGLGAGCGGNSLRADKDGALPKWDADVSVVGEVNMRKSVVCIPLSVSYPFAKLLPGQLVVVTKNEGDSVQVEPVPMLPTLTHCATASGARCFCGRPPMGDLDRFSILSSDPVQEPLLRPAVVRKSLKREHDFFCDYICLARYVCAVHRAKPYKGDRQVVVNDPLVQALEGFVLDVTPSILSCGKYTLSDTQAKLLSGHWPMCATASRGMFREAASLAETFRLVGLLQVEISFRKAIIGDDAPSRVSRTVAAPSGMEDESDPLPQDQLFPDRHSTMDSFEDFVNQFEGGWDGMGEHECDGDQGSGSDCDRSEFA